MNGSAPAPPHPRKRRLIGAGVIFTLLVWTLGCTGAVAGIAGIMHAQPGAPVAHHLFSFQSSIYTPTG